MALKKKFSKLGMGASVLIAGSIFTSALAFASPVSIAHPAPRSTPYGTMTGTVSVDCDNGYWSANTQCTGKAPTIYVKGECKNRKTGSTISSKKATNKNTTSVSTSSTTYPSYSVTVFSTHETRGQGSYTRYASVSQSI